jgi:hypothetical protein
MALITTNRLFIDVELNRAYSQFGSFSIAPQPFFIQGDQCPVEISLVRQTGVQGNPFEQVPFDPSSSFALKVGTIAAVATSTTTAVIPAAPAVIITNIMAYFANGYQVFRVEIAPNPFGGFFTLSAGASDSQPIPVSATAAQVQTAIIPTNPALTTLNTSVQKVGQFAWEISFACASVGSSITLTSTGTGLTAFSSRLMQLDMGTIGVLSLLNGAPSVEATLEFSIELSSEAQTFLLTPCTVINDL